MSAKNYNLIKNNENNMQEIGKLIANDPQKIVDLLDTNDVELDEEITAIQLTDTLVEEMPYSDSLKLGTAYILAQSKSNFTGGVSNIDVYSNFENLANYWEDEEIDEEKSNVVAGLIGGIIQGGVGLTNTIIEGKNKKKFARTDLASKQSESRKAIIEGILAEKKAKAELEAQKQEEIKKAQKRKIIIVSSLVGVILIVGGILIFKNK
jgi:hypothetical protein